MLAPFKHQVYAVVKKQMPGQCLVNQTVEVTVTFQKVIAQLLMYVEPIAAVQVEISQTSLLQSTPLTATEQIQGQGKVNKEGMSKLAGPNTTT